MLFGGCLVLLLVVGCDWLIVLIVLLCSFRLLLFDFIMFICLLDG